MFDPPESWTIEQAKAVVEREFGRDMPQIVGLSLIGWGRDDVAWFIPQGWTPEPKQNMLLGYDGKTWIEHRNKANVVSGPLVVGEAELFAGRSGVLIRDKNGWRVELGLNGTSLPAKLVLDPGGNSAVMSFYKEEELHRYRDGAVIQVVDDTGVKDDLTGLASCRYGVLTCLDGKLHRIMGVSDHERSERVAKAIMPLIDQLRRAKPDQRDAIIASMIGLGAVAYEPVKIASETEEDPEVRLMLKRVVLKLDPGQDDAREQVPVLGGAVRIDRYTPDKISFVHQLDRGDVLVGVLSGRDEAAGEPLSPGLLVIPSEGAVFYIADERINNCLLNYELLGMYNEPTHRLLECPDKTVILPGHQGQRRWSQGKGNQRWPAVPTLRLDLMKRVLLDEKASIPLAIDRQGRHFVAHSGSAERFGYTGIDVITPGLLDTRQYLDLADGIELDTSSSGLGGFSVSTHIAIDDRGRLYTVVKGGGLQRYDGNAWVQLPGSEQIRATNFVLIGRGGAVAFETGKDARLIIDGQVHAAESLEALIEAEYPRIVDHFRGGSLPITPRLGQLIVDQSDNVWLRRRHEIKVFDGEQWIKETDERLTASRKRSRFRFMAAVDGGELIYVTNLVNDPPLAYYAQVIEGKIVTRDAPHGQPAHPTYKEIREPDGTLWVASASRVDSAFEHAAVRITPGQDPLRIKGHGSP
ncbi:MAG: hypothetical protein AAF085_14785, partial [Planctomycetota bacterium]